MRYFTVIYYFFFFIGSLSATNNPKKTEYTVFPDGMYGGTVKETRTLDNFSGLSIRGALCVIEVVCGYPPSITVSGEAEVVKKILHAIDIDDDDLELHGCYGRGATHIKITVPFLDRIELEGAQYVKISNLSAKYFQAELEGSCTLDLQGKVKKMSIETSGACEVKAAETLAEIVMVESDGASKVTVSVTKELCATASGVARILYVGNPATVRKNTDDLAVIKARN